MDSKDSQDSQNTFIIVNVLILEEYWLLEHNYKRKIMSKLGNLSVIAKIFFFKGCKILRFYVPIKWVKLLPIDMVLENNCSINVLLNQINWLPIELQGFWSLETNILGDFQSYGYECMWRNMHVVG